MGGRETKLSDMTAPGFPLRVHPGGSRPRIVRRRQGGGMLRRSPGGGYAERGTADLVKMAVLIRVGRPQAVPLHFMLPGTGGIELKATCGGSLPATDLNVLDLRPILTRGNLEWSTLPATLCADFRKLA